MTYMFHITSIKCEYKAETQISTFSLFSIISTQPAFTCSNLTIETLKQGVKYMQS